MHSASALRTNIGGFFLPKAATDAQSSDLWPERRGMSHEETLADRAGVDRINSRTRRQRSANSARQMKPGAKLPVRLFSAPSTRGGKKPPRPPAAPTRPVTLP